jgi:hypothetical protein
MVETGMEKSSGWERAGARAFDCSENCRRSSHERRQERQTEAAEETGHLFRLPGTSLFALRQCRAVRPQGRMRPLRQKSPRRSGGNCSCTRPGAPRPPRLFRDLDGLVRLGPVLPLVERALTHAFTSLAGRLHGLTGWSVDRSPVQGGEVGPYRTRRAECARTG